MENRLAQLDRFDRFFAIMKENGLYQYMRLRGGGNLAAMAAGSPRLREFLGLSKEQSQGMGSFPRRGHFSPHDNTQILSYVMDPNLIRAERRWWRFLLNHTNPYTGTAYKNEPAVLCMELLNETYLLQAWESGVLTPGALPPYYDKQIDRKWNRYLTDLHAEQQGEAEELPLRQWLVQRWAEPDRSGLQEGENPGKGTVERLPARPQRSKGNTFSTARTRDLMRFYAGLQKTYFETSRAYLRSIGCQVPVVAGNWSQLSLPGLETLSGMDVVDSHIYFDAPVPQHKTGRFRNHDMFAAYGLRNNVSLLATNTLADKPLSVSETNWCFPNEQQCQFLPNLSAYASLQNFDALIVFKHSPLPKTGQGVDDSRAHQAMYGVENNPLLMTQCYMASRVFRGRVLAPGRRRVLFRYDQPRRNDGEPSFVERSYPLTLTGDWVTPALPYPYGVQGKDGIYNMDYEIALKHRTAKTFAHPGNGTDGGVYWDSGEGLEPLTKQERLRLRALGEANRIVSDTGEIAADSEKHLLQVDAPRYATVTGRLEQTMTQSKRLAVALEEERYASVAALALDGEPLVRAGRVVLSAVGRVRNSGMRWDADKHRILQWGSGPVLCEALPGRVRLRMENPQEVEVWALDGAGRKVRRVASKASEAGLSFRLNAAQTVWYLLERGSQHGGA